MSVCWEVAVYGPSDPLAKTCNLTHAIYSEKQPAEPTVETETAGECWVTFLEVHRIYACVR